MQRYEKKLDYPKKMQIIFRKKKIKWDSPPQGYPNQFEKVFLP